MKLTIKKEVFRKFHPDFKVAFILAENLNQKNKLKESKHLLQEIEDITRFLFRKESIKTHHLISPWATIQQEFGEEAKHYHTSLEKLLKKVLKKKSPKTSSTLTNLINYLSLKHLVPIAVDDFDKIKKELTFQLSTGKSQKPKVSEGLGISKKSQSEKISILKKLKKNALYYRDQKHILGLKLDFWKSPYTKPNKKTKIFLIHIEALPPITSKKLKQITQELSTLIKTFCQGKTRTFILDKKKNSVRI